MGPALSPHTHIIREQKPRLIILHQKDFKLRSYFLTQREAPDKT